MTSEKVANVKIDRKTMFFKWVEFTRPFHGLRTQLQNTLSLLLYHHYELSLVIKNNKILWKQVFDYDTKLLIAEELGIQMNSLDNMFGELRRNKVIIDNQINPVYVPNIAKDTKLFTIKINLQIDDE